MTVDARDVADALATAWDAFTAAAADDLNGWDVPAAPAEVQPGPPQPQTPGSGRAIRSGRPVSQVTTSRNLPRVRGKSYRIGIVQVTLADHHDRFPSIDLAFRHMGLPVQHTFEGPRGPVSLAARHLHSSRRCGDDVRKTGSSTLMHQITEGTAYTWRRRYRPC
jgi:hypothetical protein